MPEATCPPLPPRYEPYPTAETALLGSGGMADVFRARDRLLGDRVALKVVRPEVVSSPEFRSRFEHEVSVSASVVHPHLVPVHDLGELPDGRPYLALALADSGSLLDLRRTNPPWSLLRRLVDELLSALACLHARGILHLDVKLSNVLLHRDEQGRLRAWLSDLGLAKALHRRENFQGTLAGTLSYMPKELLLRRWSEIGPASDLFAVGVLLYRLVAASNPFRESSVPAHIRKRNHPPRHVPVRRGLVVPDGLEEIILNLLDPEPQARYDLAADVRTALATLPRMPDEWEEEHSVELGTPGERPAVPPTDMLVEDLGPYLEEEPITSEELVRAIPRWNRPHPGPIPFRPPPEPGRGARARASLALFSLRELPLVGRDAERQLLWDLARKVAAERRPQVVIIKGEAGVGRSRLLRSVTRPLEEGGYAEVVEVGFREDGSGGGYADAVRRLLRLEGLKPEEARRLLARSISRDAQQSYDEALQEATLLQRWALPEPGQPPVSSSVARQYLFDRLQRRAWRGLSVLAIEDVHWCTDPDDGAALAVDVLQLGLPVLVLVTLRSDDLAPEHPTARALETLERMGARTIELHRIPPRVMVELVEECLPLDPPLRSLVVERSRGNPLFARELIGQWCRTNALVPVKQPSGLRFTLPKGAMAGTEEIPIPEDIRSLLARRLSNVIARSRNASALGRALEVLGVAGSGLPWAVLEQAAGPGLTDLVNAGLVQERAGIAVVDHPLMAQLLRERVEGKREARAAHARLAEAWLAHSTDFRGKWEAGRHELAAGHPERALEPLLTAVRALGVAGTAAELSRAATDLLGAAEELGRPEAPYFEAQLALCQADVAMGNRQAAIQRLEFLQGLHPRGDFAIRVAARYVLTLEYQARVERGLPALEAVEPYVKEVGPELRALYHQARAACLLHLGRDGPAEREVRRALELNPPEPLYSELVYQLGKSLESRAPEEAIVHFATAEHRASRAGYRSLQARALARMARIHGIQGRWEQGEHMAEVAERLALAIGFRSHVPLCRNARAECLRFQGRIAEAETLYRGGRGWSAATGQRAWSYVFDLNLALCALLRRDLDSLKERLDAISGQSSRIAPFAPFVRVLEATWAVLQGQEPPPLRSIPVDRALEEDLDGALVVILLSRALASRARHAEATELEERARRALESRNLRMESLSQMLAVFDRARNRDSEGE